MPGPASTVVERPLRKISSEGTGVRSPLKEASFQTRINSFARIRFATSNRKMFDGNPISDGFFINATSISGSCSGKNLSLYERERSLNKLVLWRHIHGGVTSYISYYAILHTTLATCYNNGSNMPTYGGTGCWLEAGQENDRRFLSYHQGR